MKNVVLKAAAIAGVSALMISGTATMASATTLPATDSMFVLGCDSNNFTYSLGSVDASNGTVSGVGRESNIQGDCFGQGAWNPIDGYYYAIDWDYYDDSLVKINSLTGERTVIGEFYDYTNSTNVNVNSLAIDSSGNAYALGSYDIYSLDLTDASATFIGNTDVESAYAAAFDSTDTLYAMNYGNGPNTYLYTVSVADGTSTNVGNYFSATGEGLDSPYSLQFDSNGKMWVLDGASPQAVWTFDTSDLSGSGAFQWNLNDGTTSMPWFTESMVITRGTVTQPGAGTAPTGPALFSLTCDLASPYWITRVSTTDASGTGVGNSIYTDDFCFGQAAWDATTSTAYAVDWNFTNDALSKINLETGEPTMVAEFQDATSPGQTLSMYALAIDPSGNAFSTDGSSLYSVDLATGECTFIASLNGTYYAFAFNPVDGKLYGVDYSNTYGVYEINTTDGTETQVADASGFPDQVESIQFTEYGEVYIEVDDDTLWKAANAAGISSSAAQKIGTFMVDGSEYYTESLLFVPGVASLPNTGLNATDMALGGFAALLLVGAGAALVVVRRRKA